MEGEGKCCVSEVFVVGEVMISKDMMENDNGSKTNQKCNVAAMNHRKYYSNELQLSVSQFL